MIPVRLRLENFLSYGSAAPALDFDQFHVACLSGRNGQGKSALLDAVTWALWGEGRKSSGQRKPDDELLRIGQREMRVEFTFDLEGSRYRVIRTYSKTASGKTTKTQIELQVYEPSDDAYRPLTTPSVRETQTYLDGLLGIDYDTFINSAFLLQGRSDEFTKKSPTERKEILARILNLSRYDALAERARARERAAIDEQRLAEQEIERLEAALADEPGWKEELGAVQTALKDAQQRLDALRREERRLTERRARLDAQAREAEQARQALLQVARRREQDQQEETVHHARIAEADKLIARRDEIQRDYDRYEAYRRELDALDTQSMLHRGVEKQIEQKERALETRKNELEKKLHSQTVELKAQRQALADAEARLAQVPSLKRELDDARQAGRRFAAMKDVADRRAKLADDVRAQREQLIRAEGALQSRLEGLERQLRQVVAGGSTDELSKERDRLTAQDERRRARQEALDGLVTRGQLVAEQLKERGGRMRLLEQDLAALQERYARFQEVDEGVCPTCGTDLSDAHRAEVDRHYDDQMRGLQERIDADRAWMDERKGHREALLAEYQQVKQEVDALADVPERLAGVTARLEQAAARDAEVRAWKEEGAAVRRRLEAKDFAHDVRDRIASLEEQRDALPFDEAAFEQLRERALRARDLEEKLRDLEQEAGRRDELQRSADRRARDVQALRERLDDGSELGPLQEQIAHLRRQLADIGFDAERFEVVKHKHKALEGAPGRIRDLLNAQQSVVERREQLDVLRARIEEAKAEEVVLTDKLAEIEVALEGREALDDKVRALAGQRGDEERHIEGLQVQRGELSARLEQAAVDRDRLLDQRRALRKAESERALYKHLRAAFGKHGIPSLIIEQTLPEIEERANELLDRLTDGKMHVQLETIKDKKSGGTKETLEIIITDEQGVPRPYETFSGGESFRVNFALRIALAQHLAERSGVRIRTLVIDEGFGTQDAQGVQSLVESIQAIQNDFDKILVITHLDELKEAFPVRIEVEKDPVAGSSFEMIGV